MRGRVEGLVVGVEICRGVNVAQGGQNMDAAAQGSQPLLGDGQHLVGAPGHVLKNRDDVDAPVEAEQAVAPSLAGVMTTS